MIEPSQDSPQHVLDFVREAEATGVPVSLLPRVLDVAGSSIEVDHLNRTKLLGVRHFGLSRSSVPLKRSFDVAGATIGLVLLAPLFALIAVVIKRDSRGPVFFRQTLRRARRRPSPDRVGRALRHRSLDELRSSSTSCAAR